MRDYNTKGKIEFIIDQAGGAILAMLWYKNLLFRCLGQCSLRESMLILCGLVLFFCIVGSSFEMAKYRNSTSVLGNLITGFGIYTVLAYLPIRRRFILIVLSIAAALALANAILVLGYKIKNRKRFRRILFKRLTRVGAATCKLFCCGYILIMVVFGGNVIFGSAIMKASVKPATQANVHDQTIANNIDTVLLLRQEEWEGLTVDEKLDVLQTVANIEQRYLGLPNELNVGAANLREGLLGYYHDNTHEIVISMDSLLKDTSYEVLDTLCHEAYHSAQYRMVDAYNGADESLQSLILYGAAADYKEEFTYYEEGKGDFCAYYSQKCETDARDYAEEAVYDYFREIKKHIGSAAKKPGSFEYDASNKAYLRNADGEIQGGPYAFVEEGFYSSNSIHRYIGENGLMGYLNINGYEVTPPIFIAASDMSDDIACVREREDSVYYINSMGKRITRDYLDGYEFEFSGCYARVKMEDGKWAIINAQDDIIFQGADSIEDLPFPLVTNLGSAVKDGHALLFRLGKDEEGGGEEFEIVKEFQDISHISYMHELGFALVQDSSGAYGVINAEGDILITVQYQDIDYEVMYGMQESRSLIRFKLHKADGTYEFVNKEV